MYNPYAPPADDSAFAPQAAIGADGRYRIEGQDLIVADGARLPKICIKTGGRGRNERTQQFMWIPVWARFLFGALGTLAAKKATLTYFLSDEAEHERQTGNRILLVSLAGGVVIGGLALLGEMFGLAFAAFVGLILGVIVGARYGMGFRLLKIADGEVYLRLKPEARLAFADRAQRPRKKRRKKLPRAEQP
jgi:hypothetical protein